jgi:hypothetical protein
MPKQNLLLFQYAVILQPKFDKEGEVSDPGKVIVDVTEVLAPDDQQVKLIAEEYTTSLDRIQVVVRPF